MENNEIKQSFETEQYINYLRAINDKLLHKYVAERISHKWNTSIQGLILSIVILVPLGILANSLIGLGWHVIIAFWICIFCAQICDIFNSYPLSKGNIAITPAYALRQTLLKYSSSDRTSTAILLPFVIGAFIWLAFELRHAFSINAIVLEIPTAMSYVAFYVTIVIGVIMVVGAIMQTYYSTPEEINELVAEIDELNCNKEAVPGMQ